MSPAIASSSPSAAYPSRAALDAEVALYKKQLADCVNCPASSSTAEGKAHIQDLSSKISADQARIRHVETAGAAANELPAKTAKATDDANAYSARGAQAADAPKGGLVNVFA